MTTTGSPFDRTDITDAMKAAETGVWDWDIKNDVARLCSNACRLFNLDAEQGRVGLSEKQVEAKVLPSDRAARAARILPAKEHGGFFSVTFRVGDEHGLRRKVLVRGRVDRESDGTLRYGRGIVSDVTERSEGEMASMLSLCEEAADLALALWRLQEETPLGARLNIEDELRSVLWKVGRYLALEQRKLN